MGSKEPIPEMILFINSYNIREMIYQKLLGPYTGWNQYFTTFEKIWVSCEKGYPWGHLSAPDATSDSRFLYFMS